MVGLSNYRSFFIKKILFASPFVVLAAAAILIVLVNMDESDPKSTVYAVDSEETKVTRQDREEYRWNDPTNSTSKFYQVDGIPEVNFEEFIEVMKENLTANRGLKGHLLWIVTYINKFKEEIVDVGTYPEFEKLQETAFELAITNNGFSKDEKEVRLDEYEDAANEIYAELKAVNLKEYAE